MLKCEICGKELTAENCCGSICRNCRIDLGRKTTR